MKNTHPEKSFPHPVMSSTGDASRQRHEAQPHTIVDVPGGLGEADLFDTTRPGWSFDRHLAKQLGQGDTHGQLPKASKTSLLFENLRVVGMGAGATYQDTVGLVLQARR